MDKLVYSIPIISWLSVVLYMSPAMWSIYVRRARRGDPARLVCWGYGILMLGFLTRRVATGEPIDESLLALLALSAVMAWGTLFTARRYGRGPIIQGQDGA